jgi:hypothetical protein
VSLVLNIDAIERDGGTQPRASLDYEAIKEYAEAMEDGARFPAVVVFYDGTRYWLADGFHRVEAALVAGCEEIPAEVHQGTLEDAQWFSFGANKTNGIRRDDRDKQRAVESALRHPKSRGLSDSQIARHVGCSREWVRRIRERLASCNKLQDDHTRVVTRGGTTYQIDATKIGQQKRASQTAHGQVFSCGTCGETFSAPVWHCPGCDHHWQVGQTACPNCKARALSPSATGSNSQSEPDINERAVAEWTLRFCSACEEIAGCQVSAKELAANLLRGNRIEQLKKQLETTNEFIKAVLADLA